MEDHDSSAGRGRGVVVSLKESGAAWLLLFGVFTFANSGLQFLRIDLSMSLGLGIAELLMDLGQRWRVDFAGTLVAMGIALAMLWLAYFTLHLRRWAIIIAVAVLTSDLALLATFALPEKLFGIFLRVCALVQLVRVLRQTPPAKDRFPNTRNPSRPPR